MTTTTELPNITTGDYTITADCPECHRTVVLPAALSVVLTVDEESGYLRARLSTKRTEHNCGDKQNTLFEGNGAAPFTDTGD